MGSEKGRGLKDVGPSIQERRLINIFVILEAGDVQERKKQFSKERKFSLYLLLIFLGCILTILFLFHIPWHLLEDFPYVKGQDDGCYPPRLSTHSNKASGRPSYRN